MGKPAEGAEREPALAASPPAARAWLCYQGHSALSGARLEDDGRPSYVYQAPWETPTLVVNPGVAEMITLFQVNGAMIYVDPDGNTTGYDEVFRAPQNAADAMKATDSSAA